MGMPRFVSLLAAVSVLVSCATRATTSEPTVEVQPVATVAPVASVATMTEATTTTTEPTTTTTETVGRQAQRWKGATFNAVLGRWNTFVDSYIAHLEEGGSRQRSARLRRDSRRAAHLDTRRRAEGS